MVMGMLFQMSRQLVDALRKKSDLHFGRTGVFLVGPEFLDQCLFTLRRHYDISVSAKAESGKITSTHYVATRSL